MKKSTSVILRPSDFKITKRSALFLSLFLSAADLFHDKIDHEINRKVSRTEFHAALKVLKVQIDQNIDGNQMTQALTQKLAPVAQSTLKITRDVEILKNANRFSSTSISKDYVTKTIQELTKIWATDLKQAHSKHLNEVKADFKKQHQELTSRVIFLEDRYRKNLETSLRQVETEQKMVTPTKSQTTSEGSGPPNLIDEQPIHDFSPMSKHDFTNELKNNNQIIFIKLDNLKRCVDGINLVLKNRQLETHKNFGKMADDINLQLSRMAGTYDVNFKNQRELIASQSQKIEKLTEKLENHKSQIQKTSPSRPDSIGEFH